MPQQAGARGVAVAAVVVVAVIAALWLLQRRLVYLPDRSSVEPPPGVRAVTFSSADGVQLRGWVVGPSAPPGGLTVLVCNGNGGNRAHRLPLAAALADAGLQVLLFDYRGYGGNAGSPTEQGLARDARAAREYLVEHEGADPRRIVYFGESLGAGVAVGLALEHPPAALVLRSPFTSLAQVARANYRVAVPEWWLRDRFPVRRRIGDVAAPVLVVAGKRDEIVPFAQSRAVFEAADEPKRLLSIDGARHNDPALASGPRLVDAVVDFLADTVEGGRG